VPRLYSWGSRVVGDELSGRYHAHDARVSHLRCDVSWGQEEASSDGCHVVSKGGNAIWRQRVEQRAASELRVDDAAAALRRQAMAANIGSKDRQT
jgi:hypothetical protein